MAHVFVSYQHADVEWAYRIGEVIEAAGLTAWINPDPAAGESWNPWIEDNLGRAFALVAILSPASQASVAATYEWARAIGAGAAVIPVRLDSAEAHPRLAELDPLDVEALESGWWEALHQRIAAIAAEYSARHFRAPEDAPAAVVEAVAALNGTSTAARGQALERLAALDDPAARAALIDAVRHPVYAGVRAAAVDLLARRGGAWTFPGLSAALFDDDWAIMRAASQALEAHGEAAIPALEEVLAHEHRGARSGAVWALVGIGTPAAVPGLLRALTFRGWFAPRSAALKLGEIGDARAVPGLIEALHADDEPLVRLALAALQQIGTPEALAAVREYEGRASS